MVWIDKIRQVKFVFFIVVIVFAIASLVASHILVRDLSAEEHNKMELWAEAMRSLNRADEHTDLNLVLKVINENQTIPVVVMDAHDKVQTYRNISLKADNYKDSIEQVEVLGKKFLERGKKVKIALNDSTRDFILVCYDDSVLIQRLRIYPFVQLILALLFVLMAIYILLTLKKNEQNKLWVGISKETAHQLGTPISSLMAWVEILREDYSNKELVADMDCDIKRLQMVTDRFSKIGSLPELKPCNLTDVVNHVVTYMRRRISQKIELTFDSSAPIVMAPINESLFEWVIENLLKNAVDALDAKGGRIVLRLEEEKYKVSLEVEDTGKGIRKSNLGNVFRPGFTTKVRGWGLGLSLAKRIIEDYHHGKIWVKKTEIYQGTTFRIELKKE